MFSVFTDKKAKQAKPVTTDTSPKQTHKDPKHRVFLDEKRRFIERLVIKPDARDYKGILIRLRRAYILPTSKGAYYLITLVIMFIWSVNYGLSLGYAMTFFAGVFALIISVLTVNNLSHIRVHPLSNKTFFAGEPAYFRLRIDNQHYLPKIAISARRNGLFAQPISVAANYHSEFHLPTHHRQRGRQQLAYVRLSSDYPIGIFSAWVWLYFDEPMLIYPKPEGQLPLPFLPEHHSFDEGITDLQGAEDFHDLRDYQPGDNIRHILWRKMTSTQVRLKTFRDLAGQQCILDFDSKALAHLDTEKRLSQLCQWVLMAEKARTRYTLRLPGKCLTANLGEQHRAQCLEALACF